MKDYDEHGGAYQDWCQGESSYWLLEQTRFFQVIGSVQDLNVLELACGDGRISRMLMERGAAKVLATDISPRMIKSAVGKNRDTRGNVVYPHLSFQVLDACDSGFQLDPPADRVLAMYLFHYAPSRVGLRKIAQLISRNLKPGGRFVAYTLNLYDCSQQDPRLAERFGFAYRPIDPPHYELRFGQDAIDIWQWSEEDHRVALEGAGLTDIHWYAPCLPEEISESSHEVQWYIDNPSCVVVSANKPV